jgi:acyl transferase domain-containing protein
MSSILAEYESELSSITLNRPVIRMVSTVTGCDVETELCEVCSGQTTVAAIAKAYEGENINDGDCIFVEMGADSTLTRLGLQIEQGEGWKKSSQQSRWMQGPLLTKLPSSVPRRRFKSQRASLHQLLQMTYSDDGEKVWGYDSRRPTP